MRRILASALLLFPLLVGAEPFGYGYTFRLASIDIDDSDGSASVSAEPEYLNLFYTDKIARDSRYYAELHYGEFAIDADGSTVGQDVTQTAIAVSYQARFRLTRSFRPWAGAGVGYSNAEFRNRHTVDSDGYLAERFSDRAVSGFFVVLNASNYWEYNDVFDYGAHLSLELPVDSDIQRFSGGLSLLYKF